MIGELQSGQRNKLGLLIIKLNSDCLPLPNRMKEFILELNEGQQMILCDKSLCTQFIYAVFTFIFFFYI